MRFIALPRGRHAPAVAALALLLAACAGPSPRGLARPDPARETQTRQFAQRGYHPEARHGIETLSDRWHDGRGEIDVVLTLPGRDGHYPLVIYLPGLGEPATAGAFWRESWARAGYAVLALQTAADGPELWTARDARSGELTRIARERFGDDALARRLAAVDFVRREAARRAGLAASPYARIDSTRVALAGYDLGAQAAFALAGERAPQRADSPALPGLAGAIALSPHVAAAAGGFEQRYAGLRVPTLSITGYDDRDSYGLGTSPTARQAPFRYGAQPGYLLVLDGLTHRALAGNAAAEPDAPDEADAPRARPQRTEGAGPPGGGRGPRGPGGPRGAMAGGSGPGGMMPGAAPRADTARQRIVIEQVSLAFLDATVRADPIAREWLERNAPRWAEPIATLQTRP